MSTIEDLASKLVTDGLGVVDRTIFFGRKSTLPTGAGPYVSLTDYDGGSPTRVQGNRRNTRRPGVQITVRGADARATRNFADLVFESLDGLYNVTLGETRYVHIIGRQDVTPMENDANGRAQFLFNLDIERQP